ncbi:hypothetical protein ACEPAG_1980 [Sanghuangporus baumii]
MSDVLSDTDNWKRKIELVAIPVISYVQGKQRGQRNQRGKGHKKGAVRGHEHHWYAPWNCVLISICGSTRTLVPSPQRSISGTVHDNDGNPVDRRLIPDFTIRRVQETAPIRRSNRSRPSLREHFSPKGKILQKSVAFLEIKPFPNEFDNNTICNGLAAARTDLNKQIRLFFSEKNKKNGRKNKKNGKKNKKNDKKNKKNKVVIGIWAAGDYWNWLKFTPDVLGLKPASRNVDETYRPPSDSEGSEDILSDEQGSDDCSRFAPPKGKRRSHREHEEPESSGPAETTGLEETNTPQESNGGREINVDASQEVGESQGDEPQATEEGLLFFRLGTEESDAQLQEVIQAIFELPDSGEFTEQ